MFYHFLGIPYIVALGPSMLSLSEQGGYIRIFLELLRSYHSINCIHKLPQGPVLSVFPLSYAVLRSYPTEGYGLFILGLINCLMFLSSIAAQATASGCRAGEACALDVKASMEDREDCEALRQELQAISIYDGSNLPKETVLQSRML